MGTDLTAVKKQYAFFIEKIEKNEEFTLNEIAQYIDRKENSVRTYSSKKWRSFLMKNGNKYKVNKSEFMYSEAEYIKMMSQNQKDSSNPYKPELSPPVESLVEKAKESAILAIDIYNRPMTAFRTQGFTVMMVIAWTSLLHAFFEHEGIDYYYYENEKRKSIDGDDKAWELSKCIDECKELSHAAKENIKLFIALRNKIEHRFAPAFDLDICGECQALLLNFEELLTSTFSDYYSLNSVLSIPLQVLTVREPWQYEILRKTQNKHYNELKNFIDNYRASLSDDIFADNQFSFRVYLISKTGNHRSSADRAIEFIKYDPANPEQFRDIEKDIALIKEKRVQVANPGQLMPKEVSVLVEERLGKPFSVVLHTKAWKYYNVRQRGKQAEGCKTEYCHFDIPHRDYVYTQAWVDFLVEKLSDDSEYERVKSFK